MKRIGILAIFAAICLAIVLSIPDYQGFRKKDFQKPSGDAKTQNKDKAVRTASDGKAKAIVAADSHKLAAEHKPTVEPQRGPDVIFVPTPQLAVDKMLEMAQIKPGEVLYDLGCGDGRIVITAAKKYGIRAIGFDIDPNRIKESRENVKKAGVGHLVSIVHADIFTLDLSKANVITLYLLPSLNVKLMPQLRKLKLGSRIISFDFDMKGAKPHEVYRNKFDSYRERVIYKWIVPWLEDQPIPEPPRTSRASFGTVTLARAFSPDPHTAKGRSGGSTQAATHHSGCEGWVSSIPDHILELSSPFEFLRIFAQAPGNTTLVIKTPDGGYRCNTNAYGYHPALEGSWVAGKYQLWVGSYKQGEMLEYELKFTTNREITPHTAPALAKPVPEIAPGRRPDIHWVPTPQPAVDKMLEMAEIKQSDVLYDLGCGDGRIVITAAKKYGIRAMGFDIDPQRIRESRENVKKAGVEHLVTIVHADVFTLDLSEANIVTLYLLPSLNVKLMPQLRQLKPGSRIVSFSFNMQGATPDQVYTGSFGHHGQRTLYKWVVPWLEDRGKVAPTRAPDIHWVPTPQPAVDKMLEMANIQKGELLYDLGCGDGRIVITAAKKYGIKAVGFDIDPRRVKESRENVKKAGVEHLVTIKHADVFTLDLSPANVITLYLLPTLNVKLMPQLRRLRPGSRIISFDFDMKGAVPREVFRGTEDALRHRTIYKWIVPWEEDKPKPELNTSRANFGTVQLTRNFSPDPHVIEGTSGGSVQASQVDAACAGWIATNPDHTLQLTTPLYFLRIFAQSNSNTTLVIKTPEGRYRCNKGAYANNPSLEGAWAAGTYHIWLGSYEQNDRARYKLHFTTNRNVTPSSVLSTAPTRSPDVNFVPTPQSIVDKMLEMANIQRGELLYDLGCGDGRIVITAAKKYGIRAVGFDIDPQRVKESLENVKKAGVEHLVTIKHADVFTLDLSPANVITLYLLPSLNVKLMPQLRKLQPGSRIVSYSFDMKGATPDEVYTGPFANYGHRTIYKWNVPWLEDRGKPTRSPDVVFVPTPQEAVDKMLELAKIKPGELLYDLGCGDGRIVITAAKRYGIRAVGFDIDPQRVKESRENVKKAGVEHLVTINHADVFTLDLSPANVITLYLLPSLNVKLMPQLRKLKPGSRIVSFSFDMRGATPDEVFRGAEGSLRYRTIYKWVVPWLEDREKVVPTRSPDIHWVPTPQAAVDKMLEMAQIKPGELLYDLGCGDGRIVITAAKKYGIKAVGYDIDPQRVRESRENVKKAGVEHLVTIKHADVFTLDLSPANVITLYLLPRLNVKLMPQLRKLRPGSRIVSFDFDMSGAKPNEVYKGDLGSSGYHRTIYKWVVPWQEEKPVMDVSRSNFEVVSLVQGFSPDPKVVKGTSGGSTQAIDLDASCVGWVSTTPDHILKLGTSFDFLRIFAQSSGNTTLVIRMPDGRYRCNDDTYRHNPALEGSWPPGAYQIWLGSYKQGEMLEYKLHFTTNRTHIPSASIEKTTELNRTPDVVFVPTPQPVVDKMLEMAQIKPGDVLYDLGCGDGRIVVTAAKKYGIKAVGFDIDPQRIRESRENVKKAGVEHLVTIKHADIFTLDLSEANVITLYLLPSLNVKLIPQLRKLKPGSRIVSFSFDMKGVTPHEVHTGSFGYYGQRTIYKWIVPWQEDTPKAEIDTSRASFGTVKLSKSISPDPYITEGRSGGGTQSSALDANCVGWISGIPDHILTLSTPFDFLRIFAVSKGNTTLVIKTPDGRYRCNDDVYGHNPAIEGSWPAGTYHVWLGSYTRGDMLEYKVYFTTDRNMTPANVPKREVSTPFPSTGVDRSPDVIFVPTPQSAVDKMLEMAKIQKGDVLYDLGCGDGRIVITAAKKYGIKAVGFDIDPRRIQESRENVKKAGVEHLVTIKHADIFTLDLSEANVITLYLLPTLNVKLMPQLRKLKPGSRIVSYSFDMRGATPHEVYDGQHTIYKWLVPWKEDKPEIKSEPQRSPDVVFVPTPQPVVEKMLEMANIQKGDVLYDLGCGDGRIVITAAKKYGIRAIGFDIDPQRVKESRENVKNAGVEHLVTIKHADIFAQDLSPANVITLYLLPSLNVKLMPQLRKLKPGSRIVSFSFDMRGAKPHEIYSGSFGDYGERTIYKWITPWQEDEEEIKKSTRQSNFGSVKLSNGFTPDPTVLEGTSGGGTKASTINPNCIGWISSTPDHILEFSNSFDFLRIFAESPSNTTLVIKTPDGNYLCNDDTYRHNPAIEGRWSAGTYRVWLGSYKQGDMREYKLHLTTDKKAFPAASPAPVETPSVGVDRSPDVVFVPTPQSAVDKMLEMAKIQKGDVLYDLGCGDGRIVITAAKRYGIKAVGYDIDPQRIKESRENVKKAGVEHLVTIVHADVFTLDLSPANVITLYLLPSLNVKLMPQLRKLKPGSRIVSFSFDMEGATPHEVYDDQHTIYKWIVPWKEDKSEPQRSPDVIFVPTPQPVVDKMLEMAKIQKGDVLYDLGCGDGRIVITAAKKYGIKAVGFDIDPQRIKESRENVKKAGVEHLVSIVQDDIFTLDLSPANVITLYLLPSLNVKLMPQLRKLKPGSRIVSFSFDMQGAKPHEVFEGSFGDYGERTIYKWITPWQDDQEALDKDKYKSNFGTVKLGKGFSPDPQVVRGTSGGSHHASNQDNTCVGWTSSTPDHILELTDSFGFLRIFAQSTGNTTLIIKTPDGKYRCNDDTYGHNPSLEGSWPAGIYSVWLGSYKNDEMLEYTLHLTTDKNAIPTATPSISTPPPSTDKPTRTPDVVFVPTPQPAVDKMLEMAKIQKGDVLYDLGCGDGRIVITAAKKYGIKAVGYDIDPQRIKESRENVKKAGVEHLVTIVHADVFTLDLSPANVITLYLLPSLNVKLMPQLRKLKPGSRIVSFDFDMEGAAPHEVYRNTFGSSIQRTIYKWLVPWKEEKPSEYKSERHSNFGTVKLNSGFAPDPHVVEGTSGGGTQASSLNANCVGWISSTPDHILELSSEFDFLKIFVQSEGNTTLVIKTPDDKYLCNDDTYRHNPAISGSWPEGAYKVWLGSYKQGEMLEYKLHITTNKTAQPSTLPASTRPRSSTGLDRRPDVVFVPTPQLAVEKMLEMANIQPGEVLYDLGCGDGRIVVTAAKKYGIKAVGFDINPQRVRESLENVKKAGVEHLVTIKHADIFTLDLSPANVVTLYLLPSLNVKLMPQLRKLKPGSRIISFDFDMAGAKPYEVFRGKEGELRYRTIYKWIVPWQEETPEPDTEKETHNSNFGTVKLSGGFSPDPHKAKGASGGNNLASALQADCTGWLATTPDHILELSTPFEYLRIFTQSAGDTALVIKMPNGKFRCNDNTHGHNPLLEGSWPIGVYQIWVASDKKDDMHEYEIKFTTNKSAIPTSIPVKPAKSRSISGSSVDRSPDVVFVPTPQLAVDKMLELANIQPGDVLYDLGCGDGRIVVTAAKKYGIKAVGFDIDPQRIKESQENVKKAGVEHLVTIKHADIFTLDLSPANVITLYLLPSLNVKLKPQLRKLKPGSRIVSFDFNMSGAKPAEVYKGNFGTNYQRVIYKWVVPWQEQQEPTETDIPTQSSNFGTVKLNKSFSPDPHTTQGTSGGGIQASSFHADCSGWVASTPDHLLELPETLDFLKIFAQSSGNTTLVIKMPDGKYRCNDDTYEHNPALHGSWEQGTYKIWLGSFKQGEMHSYKLMFTTNKDLKPQK